MRLDVIIPTYNRHTLLDKTLSSLRRASMPSGLDVRVTVVDNNSNDRTTEVVERWKADVEGGLDYLFEPQQGRSSALNAGIRSTHGDLVGMIDDDEEIDAGWYARLNAAFTD